jgi:hypothetical protein
MEIQEHPPSTLKNINGSPQAPLGGLIPIWDLSGVL